VVKPLLKTPQKAIFRLFRQWIYFGHISLPI